MHNEIDDLRLPSSPRARAVRKARKIVAGEQERPKSLNAVREEAFAQLTWETLRPTPETDRDIAPTTAATREASRCIASQLSELDRQRERLTELLHAAEESSAPATP